MVTKSENNEKSQNYVELTESQIFDKIKEELTPIQEELAEKKITVKKAKSELIRINKRLQWTKLEKKEEIWKAFDNLAENLEKSIEKNSLHVEFDEVLNQIEKLTKKDLANLKRWIQQNKQRRNPERTTEVQQWIDESANNLASTIYDASQDKNPIARKIWEWMNYLMS